MEDYRILLLEAKDIYEAGEDGLRVDSFVYENGKLNKRFKSVFSDSLDLRYLLSFHKVKNDKNAKAPYMTEIINVSFQYKSKDMSTKDLRKWIYESGFKLNGTEYVRYKRSSGSSREGQCLFIQKNLNKKMQEWSSCGINPKSDKVKNNLVSWEAYRSLSLSGIEDTIELDPKNILVLDDFDSTFEEECAKVSIQDKNLTVEESKAKISNKIWDGEGLLDSSMFAGKYEKKGMMLLRNRFFKTCAFNTNLQQWFKDNGITEVSQLKGKTNAKSINEIKLVVTESSIKYLKFGTLDEWRNNTDKEFGIVKTDKPTHYFDGEMVQTSYQFLNTLQLSEDDVIHLLSDSFNYIENIQKDIDVVRYHLSSKKKDKDDDKEDNEELSCDNYRDEITLNLLRINRDFANTQAYKNFKSKLQTSLRNKLKNGKILLNGTNATLFGNGYELLEETIGKFDHDNPSSRIPKGCIICKRFNPEEKLTCARSPHITMGNLYLVKNIGLIEYDKYFNLSKEIVCVNAIGENIQQKLNGCDYDSDTMLITNNELVYEKVKRNYDKFLVPVSATDPDSINFPNKELYEIDYLIQENYIGEIVNLSQYMNSLLWDKLSTNPKYDYKQDYLDICKLAVLSGMEIDKAKRTYGVDVNLILKSFDDKKETMDDSVVYPIFLKYLKEEYDKKRIGKKKDTEVKEWNSRLFNTTMDYVWKQVDENSLTNKERSKSIPISDLCSEKQKAAGNSYKQRDRVLKIAKDTLKAMKAIQSRMTDIDLNPSIALSDMRNALREGKSKLRQELSNQATVYLILDALKENEDLTWTILYFLYQDEKNAFYRTFARYDFVDLEITDTDDYDVMLYGRKFKKIEKINAND